jgi:hypothetical protein
MATTRYAGRFVAPTRVSLMRTANVIYLSALPMAVLTGR